MKYYEIYSNPLKKIIRMILKKKKKKKNSLIPRANFLFHCKVYK